MEALREWQSKRRDQTIAAVEAAIAALEAAGEAINFRSVSQASGVSRKSLYAASEARALILAKRDDSGGAAGATDAGGLSDEAALFARIAELESENRRLKDILYSIRSRIGNLGL